MPMKLHADEFVGGPQAAEIPGRTVITEFGFDPKLCDITVSDDDVLCVKQEGRITLIIDSPYWRRVSPVA